MKSLFIIAIVAILPVAGECVAAQPENKEIPVNWAGFKASTNPDDKKLVAEIEKKKWWDVCRDWGKERRSKSESRRAVALREFLLNDESINGVDLMHVASKEVAVGMTACGVFASLGNPDKINYTTSASKMRSQMVFHSRGMYVYTEGAPDNSNGIVKSFQH